MTLATILSRTQQGLEAPLVRVEVHVGSGLPAFSIVGLPETAVKESKDRVRAALANCGFDLPSGHITVNLAPADLPKEGGRFDLPIAIGILVASAQLPPGPFDRTELYGELSLGGDLHAIRGALPTALQGTRAGHTLILPSGNIAEAALARRGRIHGARASARRLQICKGPAATHRWLASRSSLPACAADRTSPTFGARRTPDAHSRLRQRVSTACCSSARPERARACSHSACRGSWRR